MFLLLFYVFLPSGRGWAGLSLQGSRDPAGDPPEEFFEQFSESGENAAKLAR
jgi:hypothetical protein